MKTAVAYGQNYHIFRFVPIGIALSVARICVAVVLLWLMESAFRPAAWIFVGATTVAAVIVTATLTRKLARRFDLIAQSEASLAAQNRDLEESRARLERQAADLGNAAEALRRANCEAEAARTEAENARRHAEETSRQLLEAQRIGRFGHWITDEAAKTAVWSPQMFEITGLPPQTVLPLDLSRVPPVHPEDAAGFHEVRQRAIACGETQTVEVRFVRPDDTIRWVHIEMRAHYDEAGGFAGLFGTTQDITERHQTEDALKAAREQLIDAIESFSEGFVLFDREDRYVLANSRYTSMYPYLGQTIVPGTPYVEMLRAAVAGGAVPLNGQDPERWVEQKLAWHRECAGPREALLSNGRWVRMVERRMRDGGIVGIRTDITERKHTEEALAAAQVRLIDAIESMSDGFALFDKDDRYVLTNSNYRRLYADRMDLFLPGIRYEDMLRESVARGRDLGGEDGEVWVRRMTAWHQACAEPIERQAPDGRWLRQVERRTSDGGIVGIRTDITATKAAEAALLRKVNDLEAAQQHLERLSRELQATGDDLVAARDAAEEKAAALTLSETRFRDYAMTSSDWFWETDAEHRITYVSDGIRAFGQDPASRVGRSRVEIAAESDRNEEKWEQHLSALNRHEPFRDFVFLAQFLDQPGHTVSISGQPFFDAAGEFLGYRGTGRDISAQVQAETMLREAKQAAESANLAKSQFLANMSHELRTPLNAIIGFSEMIELRMKGPVSADYQEYAKLIHLSGDHLHQVINDILDLAKIDADKFQLREEADVDPRHIAEACVALVRENARAAEVHLSLDVNERVPLLIADPTRLKQILLNLLSNAIKFTPPGGSIVVVVQRAEKGGVLFEVSDSGVGMTADEIEIALQPFGQVDSSYTRKHAGTGLGLTLARRLAELHGGSLSIVSDKGNGTVVRIVLPAGKATDLIADAAE